MSKFKPDYWSDHPKTYGEWATHMRGEGRRVRVEVCVWLVVLVLAVSALIAVLWWAMEGTK